MKGVKYKEYALVEKDGAGVELILEAQLFVVDRLVSPHEIESLVKVLEGGFELTNEEVADAGLEVSNGEIVVEVHGGNEVLNLKQGRGGNVRGS